MTTQGAKTEESGAPQKDDEARKLRELCQLIDFLRIEELNTMEQMMMGYHSPEEFSDIINDFRDKFFFDLGMRGIFYHDFRRMMMECITKERKETGEKYPTTFWQLVWVTTIFGDEIVGL